MILSGSTLRDSLKKHVNLFRKASNKYKLLDQWDTSILTEHGSVDGLELLDAVREGNDLSGADKGEVQGVKIHNHIFTLRRNMNNTS